MPAGPGGAEPGQQVVGEMPAVIGLLWAHCRRRRPISRAALAALPEAVAQWSLTSLREKLVKSGAKVVRHARYAIFQMAEVAVPRELFEKMLRLIDGLRRRQAPA